MWQTECINCPTDYSTPTSGSSRVEDCTGKTTVNINYNSFLTLIKPSKDNFQIPSILCLSFAKTMNLFVRLKFESTYHNLS